jgi:hypothetical protein
MTKIEINKEQLIKIIKGIAHDLREEFADASPKDTGYLMRNIDYEVIEEGGNFKIRFTFPDYALYLEYGTGIYAEIGKKERIKPKSKKALRFTIGNEEIIVKSVAGMKPQPFIRPVIHSKLKKIVEKNILRHTR